MRQSFIYRLIATLLLIIAAAGTCCAVESPDSVTVTVVSAKPNYSVTVTVTPVSPASTSAAGVQSEIPAEPVVVKTAVPDETVTVIPATPVEPEIVVINEPADSITFISALPADTITVTPIAAAPIAARPDSLSRRNGKIVIGDIDPAILTRKVIVGNDTVDFIIPQRNYGRYDRGLFNFLFVPRGQWQFGLTASYGQLNTEDVQVLSLLKNLNLKGTLYSLKPTVSYFFNHNQSIGLRFTYSRGELDLGGLSVDIDDDMNFSLSDISYYSNSYTGSIFYRNYVGLSEQKRFAVFNEVEFSVGSGASRFKRLYNGEPRDTRTLTTKLGLNFSPGLCVFIMDNVCFNISFGVFGLHVTRERQITDGVEEGTRTSSGANFRFNLFNINFGLGVNI